MPRKSSVEFVDYNIVNKEVVKSVKEKIPSDQTLNELGSLFKIIGELTRVKILYAIAENEMCVSDISALLNMSQSAVSHQLKVLKKARIVKNRREGKNIYYSLDDEHIKQIFNMGLTHIGEIESKAKK